MSKADRLYRRQPTPLADFVFDEQVVEVFDDMIHRSVPGYDTLLGLIAVIAEKHSQAGSRVYDLGCSLGAVTRAIHARLQDAPECYVCIDNSPAMAAQCRAILQCHLPPNRWRVDCRDAAQVEIANAGVVVLNFTLQFIRPDERQAVLSRLYHGMLPAGVLVLSEKIRPRENSLLGALHTQFKSANGYSALEISRKRSALERVMQLDTEARQLQRLRRAGFARVERWFQCFDFCSYIAIK